MRLQHLDLLRYGKFTDRRLAFPAAPRDFHLVVGVNEAGKSTTRSAILDLLYGIELRSPYDFLHTKAEMRLGATLVHAGESLDVVRTKARTRSLLGPGGEPVTDAALAAFLGNTERGFFDQMFGLDHPRLVRGGQDILDSANDIGQILFQSAAGIGGLGAVREQLEREADGLWGARKSGGRAYYVAADRLAQADAALKQATVRTKDWVEGQRALDELTGRRDALRERHRALETDRLRLERVRRVAVASRQWREAEAELRALGDVIGLPADAAARLAQAEVALAGARRDHALFASQAADVRARRARIHPDERLLRHAADIEALAARHQQVRNHDRDIERRLLEIDVHWQQAAARARQLGWTVADAEALAARLPTLPRRAAVATLAKRFAVLDQARRAAEAALADREADRAALEAQGRVLSVASVPPVLRVALAEARALGDTDAALARDAALLRAAERDRATARAALGRAGGDPAALRALVPPSEADIRERLRRQADDAQALHATEERHADLRAQAAAQRLAVAQYRRTHQPVSRTELAEARTRRDATWTALRAGAVALPEAAPDFEARLRHADALADQRHDKAQEAGELQARLDALERLQLQLDDTAARAAAHRARRDAGEADWRAVASALGLDGLALRDVEAWRTARDRVLRAEAACTEAADALAAGRRARDAASGALRAALDGAGIACDAAAPLAVAIVLAGDAVERATETRARAEELARQQASLAAALERQRDATAQARAALDAWHADWRVAVRGIGLDPDGNDAGGIDVAGGEGALDAIAAIEGRLESIRDLRHQRVDAMRHDLADFDAETAAVVAAVAPELAGRERGAAAVELAARLADARDAHREAERLREEGAAREAQARDAAAGVARARAMLAPLLRLAGEGEGGGAADADGGADDGADGEPGRHEAADAASHDRLRGLVARSDHQRRLARAVEAALGTLEAGGDGLSIEALEAEVAAVDAAQVPARTAGLAAQLDEVRQAQDALTVQITQAEAALGRIAGQDDAARAESQRQNALAEMADAAERYVRVHTASRLLKWAIDRYRETRQGPLLGRAGAIFAGLTRGSFQKLSVDFDSEPLTLHGLRADGQVVPIAGMSDGTRDQLYLALRLAALEMHLAQSHALPFIADDLFINYDDGRSEAGLRALAELSTRTQVIFLSHHDHLVPTVQRVFGGDVNVVAL
ncbi:AAA family ATPase [Comamonadaceae bacterium OTU4NAUVB1]|nr:AAA family ATPase [Comamonadaceae bacterium OTU4NAUVB1]